MKFSSYALLVGAAAAAPSRIDAFFTRFDTNKDGSVTQAEVTAAATKAGIKLKTNWKTIFANIDADADGSITKAELTKFATAGGVAMLHVSADEEPENNADTEVTATAAQSRIDAFFTRFDTNKDGSVTQAEVTAAATKAGIKLKTNWKTIFANIDADSDGSITKAELTKFATAGGVAMFHVSADEEPENWHHANMWHHAAAQPEFAAMTPAAQFKMFDTNNDGNLSVAEVVAWAAGAGVPLKAGWKAGFNKVDTNGDGLVSKAEFNAANASGVAMWHHADAQPENWHHTNMWHHAAAQPENWHHANMWHHATAQPENWHHANMWHHAAAQPENWHHAAAAQPEQWHHADAQP